MLLKRCSGSFLEIICFMTNHVFKSELTKSSLSWNNFFPGKFDEKIVFITVFAASQLIYIVLNWR